MSEVKQSDLKPLSLDFAQETLDLLDSLVTAAKKAGADACDAVAVKGRSRAVSWREGKLEDSEGSEGEDLGLRVLIGHKQAITSSSDRSPSALKELVERTVAMAKAVPDDPFCGQAPEERLFKGPIPDLDIYDNLELDVDALAGMARDAEAAARAVPGITTCDGTSASFNHGESAIVTSHGFAGASRGSSYSVSLSAVAEHEGQMERDYDFSSKRHAEDLDAPELIGTRAGHKAVARLGAKKMPSGRMPVVYSPRVANSLLGHLVGAISGPAVARGTSFLRDMWNEEVFQDEISIVDDPIMPRGLKSRGYDGEGLQTKRMAIVADGVLESWILNAASAKQLNMPLTGHAARGTSGPPGVAVSNLFMMPGTMTPDELISDIKDGLYITELIGMGVNGVTGDYSRGAAGFRIQNGQFTESISEVTVAGNLKDMYQNLTPANDLAFKYGINAPTLRVEGLTIAGE